ncbi:MAG: MlaD family protein [Solirubrobacterales bacterium]
MDHRIPTTGAALSIVAVVIAVLSFVFLNARFDGPNPLGGVASPYELEASFDDVENLPTKQSVLSHGVEVGRVTAVDYHAGSSTGTVKFTVDGEFAPVYRDATARIGERTILGDPFLDLDRGHPAAGEASAGTVIKGLPSVDFDEALDFLDARGRAHLRSLVDTLSRGAATEGNGERLNGTVGGLSRTVTQLRRVTEALHGQEDQIAAIAGNGSTVLGVLGDRERALRTIVASGRLTLDALASNAGSLRQAVAELPGLLSAARSSLHRARPLLGEARPLVRRLRAIAPKLRPAIAKLGPISGDAASIIAGLRPLRRAAAPLLAKTREALVLAGPVIDRLAPAVRNLVPLLGYLAPRADGVAAFFSNIAGALDHGDSQGKWARFSFNLVPPELAGGAAPGVCSPEDDIPVNSGVCSNAYPLPGDARNPEPYLPGSYPRLRPFDPPPRP